MRSDETLVHASRTGDRDAFGAVVVRYQGLVCGLTFNATGDLATSEDLAQQTFLTAWSRLGELQDPARLRAWLAGIARNLVRHHRRTDATPRPTATEPTAMQEMLVDAQPSPLNLAARKDQARQVWAMLEQVPEPYRETLVLYYRAEKSVASVADVTGASVDAVKQRLSRGRKMLREEIARSIEESLFESRPDRSFSAAILAALPGGTAGSIAGSAAGSGGLASMLSKLPLVGPWLLGPLLGIAGAVFGAWCSLRAAESPAEKRYLWQMILFSSLLAVVHLAVLLSISFGIEDPTTSTRAIVATWLVWAIVLAVMVVRGNARWRQIRDREATRAGDAETSAQVQGAEPVPILRGSPTVSVAALRGSLFGMYVGSSMWIFLAAGLARDWFALSVAVTAIGLLCARGWRRAPSCRTAAAQVGVWAAAILESTALWFVLCAWRWSQWAVPPNPASAASTPQILGFILLLGGGVGGSLLAKARRVERLEGEAAGGDDRPVE